MRMMVKITIGAADGSRALKDGSMAQIMENFAATHKPESAYFGVENGERTAYYVIDMTDVSQMPAIAEPSFAGLNARISFTPVMNAEELRAGLQKLFK